MGVLRGFTILGRFGRMGAVSADVDMFRNLNRLTRAQYAANDPTWANTWSATLNAYNALSADDQNNYSDDLSYTKEILSGSSDAMNSYQVGQARTAQAEQLVAQGKADAAAANSIGGYISNTGAALPGLPDANKALQDYTKYLKWAAVGVGLLYLAPAIIRAIKAARS
jgi:hypothetical protein